MNKMENVKSKIDYEIILYGVEPFTNIGNKIRIFLDDIIKHNLIATCSWNTIDKKRKYKKLKRFFKYIIKKINEYR